MLVVVRCISPSIMHRNRDSRSRSNCFVVTRLQNSGYFGQKSGRKPSKSNYIVLPRCPSGKLVVYQKICCYQRWSKWKRPVFAINRERRTIPKRYKHFCVRSLSDRGVTEVAVSCTNCLAEKIAVDLTGDRGRNILVNSWRARPRNRIRQSWPPCVTAFWL